MPSRAIVGFVMLASVACGSSSTRSFSTPTSSTAVAPLPPQRPVPVWPSAPSITSLSTTTAIAGSDDITLTITGTNYQPPGFQPYMRTCAVWTFDNVVYDPHPEKMLDTRFVSDTQLTARIPAAYLKTPAAAQVGVTFCDAMDDTVPAYVPHSNRIPFTVVPSP
jgi:hypothetical protein